MVSHPLENLLGGLVDYAGLFPPARLDMEPAVAEYAEQRRSELAWILGRFVVPTARLDEMEAALDRHHRPEDGPWPLSALPGTDLEAARERIDRLHASDAPRARVESLEYRPSSAEDVARAARLFAGFEIFYEIVYDRETAPVLAAIAEHGGAAKIRTGGITADAIPTVPAVARFLRAVRDAGVPFKATAGLHHPLRGDYRLTYEDDSPVGTMHGFLNLFLAAAFVRQGELTAGEIEELLGEQRAGTLDFSAAGVSWNGHRLLAEELAETRRHFALSYGSCSFREPVDDLRALRLL